MKGFFRRFVRHAAPASTPRQVNRLSRRRFLASAGCVAAVLGAPSDRAQAALTLLGAGSGGSVLTSVDGPTTASSGTNTGYTEGWVGRSTTATPGTSTITALRQGYTAAGAATTYADTITVTQQLRQVYPSQASLASGMYALSDYVYATDVVDGGACVNNSTLVSPQVVGNWTTPDRLPVGNTLGGTSFPVSLIAGHLSARNGKPIACAVFTISDGSTSITVTVTGMSVPGYTGDLYSVQEYALPATDISSLTDAATITVNAKLYPWIGVAASTLDSSTSGAGLDGFSPRYFRRWTARVATQPLAYVSSTGNDSTGIWSATAATAAATPFLTIAGAQTGVTAARNTAVTSSIIDGCEIRVGSGSFALPNQGAGLSSQRAARFTITRDPGVAKASAIVTFGAAVMRLNSAGGLSGVASDSVRVYDVTVKRTGASTTTGSASGTVFQWENVILDPNGTTTTWLSNANSYHGVYGLTVLAAASVGVTFSDQTNGRFICLRGLDIDCGGSGMTGWNVIGSRLANASASVISTRVASGSIVAFNRFNSPPTATGAWVIGASTDAVGAMFVGNVVEWTSTTSNRALSVSADGATGNLTHILLWNNTIAGSNDVGRCNLFYDEKQSTYRAHKFIGAVGNILPQLNNKSDWYVGVSVNAPDAPNHVAAWAFYYGVGCRANIAMFQNAGAVPQFAQAYAGLASTIGTSSTVRLDPSFVSWQAVTVAAGPTYTAGAGSGDYRLVDGTSIAAGILASAVLAFTTDGVARSAANDNAGALSRAA